jgi:peptidoglycan lytic transglycosylase
MKRTFAYQLSFFVASAFVVGSGLAVAKTEPIPLPDRNPERPAAMTAEVAPENSADAETVPEAAASGTEAAAEEAAAAGDASAEVIQQADADTTAAFIPAPKRNLNETEDAAPEAQAAVPSGMKEAVMPALRSCRTWSRRRTSIRSATR